MVKRFGGANEAVVRKMFSHIVKKGKIRKIVEVKDPDTNIKMIFEFISVQYLIVWFLYTVKIFLDIYNLFQ